MTQRYETDFRPNYELYLAMSWCGCGVLSIVAMLTLSGFSLGNTLTLSSVFFVFAGYQWIFAQRRLQRMRRLERQELAHFTLSDLRQVVQPEALYMGSGFEWTSQHAQKVSDLYRDPERLNAIKAKRRGATYLHGVGSANEAPVYLLDAESKGHVHIVGTTGAGKTRLFDLLVTQAILRGEPVIIIDPKGDRELKNNAEATYQRLHRGRDFAFFHPAYVDESAAINPLATRQRGTELASRLAAIIPSGTGSGDVFQSFSQNALNGIFYAVEIGGQNPTIMDVQRSLSEGFGPLCIRAFQGWAYLKGPEIERGMKDAMAQAGTRKMSDEQRAVAGAAYYQQVCGLDRSMEEAGMLNLISLLLHDRDHFKKMVASLVPIVGQLTAGPLATLFSPDPSAGRMPKSGVILNFEQVIQNGGGCYVGLDTLSDPIVGRAIGQMILADLASLGGKRYNFRSGEARFVNIFVDEASEVTNPQLIQLLNKGRGAGFRLFVATQTLADYEAATGSAALAAQLLGNMNSTIMLRTLDPDTQERLSARLPEVSISYVMKTTGTSLGDATGDPLEDLRGAARGGARAADPAAR